MHHIADLVAKKRETLCRTVNQAMEDLIMEIAKKDGQRIDGENPM